MIDTHLHLDDQQFDGKVEQVLSHMQTQGVSFVINNSCNYQSMVAGVQLANKYPQVYATIGMHPHDASSYDSNFVQAMTQFATNSKVVAVGEIGLDYYYDLSPRNVQKDVFAQQIELADKLHLPITLHVRDAYGDALDILQAQHNYLNNGVLWHCYSGSSEFAKTLVKMDHYFAFGGAITFKNANKGEVLNTVPFDRILSETDSPYLAPVPLRGTTNTPSNIPIIVSKIAELINKPVQDVEQQILTNALRLFTKIKV